MEEQQGAIFWFRRDLRLEDNAGLYHALKAHENVLPIFIFDTNILGKLDADDKRVVFIHRSLTLLHEKLAALGSTVKVYFGDPLAIISELNPKALYTNHDYEPYAKERDEKIKDILQSKGGIFHTFKDQVIFEKDEVLKDNGAPYTVFTPYSKKWKAKLNAYYLKPYPTEQYAGRLLKTSPSTMPTLAEMGFKDTKNSFPERLVKSQVIAKYHEHRDFPAIAGTTKLSVHLRFGTVSIRKLAQIALEKNGTWLNELIWREFYAMILWHFPHVVGNAFKPAYDRIAWRDDPESFECWCNGQTGYPIVDAGMRELNTTGFMHNRARMIVASFLTKHLLLDWRLGEAYFAQKLLDFELASNNGGWQWAAGSGCDAAPYFRVFNPELQTQKFDKDFAYIKQWVPEYNTAAYAKPIVEHKMARVRAIDTYKSALNPS